MLINSSLYERAKNLLINVIGTGNILNFISNFSLFRATFKQLLCFLGSNFLVLASNFLRFYEHNRAMPIDEQLYNKSSCSSQATLLCRGGGGEEAQIHFYIGGLIIFVRDCLKFRKICGGFMHCFVDFIAWLLLFYLINVHIE